MRKKCPALGKICWNCEKKDHFLSVYKYKKKIERVKNLASPQANTNVYLIQTPIEKSVRKKVN